MQKGILLVLRKYIFLLVGNLYKQFVPRAVYFMYQII